MTRSVEQSVKIGKVKRGILRGLAAGAVISVGVMAPNALRVFKPFLDKKRYSKYNFWNSLKLLEKNGLVKLDSKNNYQLTEEGHNKLLTFSADLIKAPIRWDRKWRVVIFDIPKGREGARKKLRNIIQGYGFMMLQKSVWVYPYPCEDLITLLKGELRLGKQLLYMVVDALEGDRELRKYFKL